MSDQDTAAARRPVQVYIFNQTYNLRSASDEEHVRRVARLVDARMRQISELLPNHDALKVAVMTALHIAEELENIKASQAEQPDAPRAEETPAEREEAAARRTWFEDVFDSEFTGDRDGGRLSARVSERLQTRKQERRAPVPSADEETSQG
jgi:cell division protein ZapA (FtsZ GTPase activity inhibitor)